MRLTDADALREEMLGRFNRFRELKQDSIAQDYNFAATIIGNAPTVDAVPVVRCRECRHYNGEYCTNPYGLKLPGPRSFCDCGQRKKEDVDNG